jgi:hypothetical protein
MIGVITVMRLDDVFDQYAKAGDRVSLKLDMQGFEDEVLNGAASSIDRIAAVQTEMSIVPTYIGQRDMRAMIDHLCKLGFSLFDLTNGFAMWTAAS